MREGSAPCAGPSTFVGGGPLGEPGTRLKQAFSAIPTEELNRSMAESECSTVLMVQQGGTTVFKLKRVYDEPSPDDGYRVLVDRLWPRGLSRANANLDEWMQDIAPSTEVRKRFGHDPAKWDEFHAAYTAELAEKPDRILQLRQLEKKHGTVTLLYGAKDQEHNQAVVLEEILGAREPVRGGQ